jgi:hypothetical protein
VFEGTTLVDMSDEMNEAFKKWQRVKGKREDGAKMAFIAAMAEWHSREPNKNRFQKLAVGQNLRSYALMSPDVAGALRSMLTFNASDRPTARAARIPLLAERHEPAPVTVADTVATPMPMIATGDDDLTVLATHFDMDALADLLDDTNQPAGDLPNDIHQPVVDINGMANLDAQILQLNQPAAQMLPVDAIAVESSGDESDEANKTPVDGSVANALKRKHNIANTDAKAAALIVKKMRRQMRKYGPDKARLSDTLKRKNTAIYERARTILSKADLADPTKALVREERLLLAALADEQWEDEEVMGRKDPRRELFQALTKRGYHWWHKNYKKAINAMKN